MKTLSRRATGRAVALLGLGLALVACGKSTTVEQAKAETSASSVDAPAKANGERAIHKHARHQKRAAARAAKAASRQQRLQAKQSATATAR